MLDSLRNSLFVAIGGGLGALLRHLINLWTAGSTFPVGTVIENVSGALLLGMVVGYLATARKNPQWLRAGVGAGFCGGYTTTSTFAADSFLLAVRNEPIWAAVYVVVSLLLGFFAALAGMAAGESVGRTRREAP